MFYWGGTGMPTEYSCGAVVFTAAKGERRYLIIREKEDFWGFPKGHMEKGETEEETALREILEETGLRVRLLKGFRTEDSHALIREGRPGTVKHVTYFLAAYTDQTPRPQAGEIAEIALLTFREALDAFQYESSRRILTEAEEFLEGQNKK